MATQHATVTELRRQTADICTAVRAGHHQLITQHEQPVVAVVPIDWYEYAAAAIQRVEQIDACFKVSTIRAPRPKSPEESP